MNNATKNVATAFVMGSHDMSVIQTLLLLDGMFEMEIYIIHTIYDLDRILS